MLLLGALACFARCAAGEREVVVPLERQVEALEPLKGLVFWQSLAESEHETYGRSIALEFVYLLYNEVAVDKSDDGSVAYNWSVFEARLDDIKSRGHQAIVRMRYTEPGEQTAVPDFIKRESGYQETKGDPDGEETYYPDWRSEALMDFHEQFYKDLAERYDSDPRVAFFQSGFGHWAEYHISGTPLNLGVNFPSRDFQTRFFKSAVAQFNQTPISFGIESGKEKYSPVPHDPELQRLGYGVFDDSFMHAEHDYWQGDGYNEGCLIACNYTTRMLRAPIGGEISYYDDDDQHSFLAPDGIHGTTWERAAAKYHITYMFANDCLEGSYATPQRVAEAGMHAGYHLLVTDFRATAHSASVTVTNTGIAPVYHPLFVTVNGVRAQESLRLLAPNSTKQFVVTGLSIDLDAAALNISLTITSPKLYANQTVPFEAHISASARPQHAFAAVLVVVAWVWTQKKH